MRSADYHRSSQHFFKFQPAYLEFEDKSYIALLCDISVSGAVFESDIEVIPDQPIRYKAGNSEFQGGKVSWIKNGRFGIQHDVVSLNDNRAGHFKYRSVRIPAALPATVYVNSSRHEAEIVNFSQRGLCVRLHQTVAPGSIGSVEVGQHLFEGAVFKWSQNERNGVALAGSLRISEMASLLGLAAD